MEAYLGGKCCKIFNIKVICVKDSRFVYHKVGYLFAKIHIDHDTPNPSPLELTIIRQSEFPDRAARLDQAACPCMVTFQWL